MEQSSFWDEATIRHQYDCLYKKVLKWKIKDYQKKKIRQQKREVLMSELLEKELNGCWRLDEYETDKHWFHVLNYNIAVKDILLAEAIKFIRTKAKCDFELKRRLEIRLIAMTLKFKIAKI